MSQNQPTHIWFNRLINLDEIYYILFHEQPREMTKKELHKYNEIMSQPMNSSIANLYTMNPDYHPNCTPVKGRDMIDYANTKGLIPMFDRMFPQKRLITLVSAKGISFFHKHSKWKGLG